MSFWVSRLTKPSWCDIKLLKQTWFAEIENFKWGRGTEAQKNLYLNNFSILFFVSLLFGVCLVECVWENVCLSVSPSAGLNPPNPSQLDSSRVGFSTPWRWFHWAAAACCGVWPCSSTHTNRHKHPLILHYCLLGVCHKHKTCIPPLKRLCWNTKLCCWVLK